MVAKFPGMGPMFHEHVTDNFGEILPHVFFADVTRYVVSLFLQPRDMLAPRRELQEILSFLEATFSKGDNELCELIAVSFLENLPQLGEPGSDIRQMLGPELKRQLYLSG
jgi:hypothetical protein